MTKINVFLIISAILVFGSLASCADPSSGIDSALEEIEAQSSGGAAAEEPEAEEPSAEEPSAEEQVLYSFKEVFIENESGELEILNGSSIDFPDGITASASYIVMEVKLEGTENKQASRDVTLISSESEISVSVEFNAAAIIRFEIPEETFSINFSGGKDIKWTVVSLDLE